MNGALGRGYPIDVLGDDRWFHICRDYAATPDCCHHGNKNIEGSCLVLLQLPKLGWADPMLATKREATFKNIIDANRNEIQKRFPKVMRRVQGYNLDAFVDTDRWNLAKLIVGSEGTLGIVLEAKLNLEPLPKYKALCFVHFSELLQAIRTVELF